MTAQKFWKILGFQKMINFHDVQLVSCRSNIHDVSAAGRKTSHPFHSLYYGTSTTSTRHQLLHDNARSPAHGARSAASPRQWGRASASSTAPVTRGGQPLTDGRPRHHRAVAYESVSHSIIIPLHTTARRKCIQSP